MTHAQITKAQFPQEEWSNRYGNLTASAQPTLQPLPTPDGGFLILSGEYSGANNPAPRGDMDLVITKTNRDGFIQWQKVYGGSGSDYSPCLNFIKANGGGYLVVGNSNSVDMDLPADNDPVKGNLWILKIDENGNILFSKIIKSDYDTYEYILSIIPANDGNGYLGVLNLNDNAPGTHPPGFFTNCTGGTLTYKLIKLNNTGDVTYQKCFVTDNGNINRGFSITNGPGNKYLLSSNGMITGNCNISQPAFLGMINDTLHYYWQKTVDQYGLPSTHYFGSWPRFDVLVKDHDFIIPLRDGSDCNYPHPMVLMRIDTLGNLVWKNMISNMGFSELVTPVDAGDNNSFYIMQNPAILNSFEDSSIICKFSYTGSLIAKKLLSIHKNDLTILDFRQAELFKLGTDLYYFGTNTGHNYDPNLFTTWTKPMLGKLGPVNSLAGYAFLDTNHNNIKDAGEIFIKGLKVLGQKANGHFSLDFTDSSGRYQMITDTGAYTYNVSAEGINNFTIFPTPAITNRLTYLFADTINFALTAIPGKNDISVSLLATNVARPGFQSTYRLMFRNNGVTPVNASLKFIKKPAMTLNSSSRPYTSLVGDTITWNYTGLGLLTTDTISLSFNIPAPPVVNANDTLNLLAFASIPMAQTDSTNDTVMIRQVVRNSFDPNDKEEKNAGRFSLAQVASGKDLQYTIRFQNMGTYPASTIIVRDTLDARLDWRTLKIIATSHTTDFSLRNEKQLEWKFDNINLPAASTDDPGSRGFITYTIKPLSTIQEGEVIKNKASIYFDYNLPVVTNETQTIIYNSAVTIRTYTFIGTGSWSNPANWVGGVMPSSTLLAGDQVTINGICTLDIIVHANAGSGITVAAGKSLLVQGNLIIQ